MLENQLSYDNLTLTKLFFQKSVRNREKQLAGIPTLIPFNKSFSRLSNIIPGITHGEQIIISASTAVGGTILTFYLYLQL